MKALLFSLLSLAIACSSGNGEEPLLVRSLPLSEDETDPRLSPYLNSLIETEGELLGFAQRGHAVMRVTPERRVALEAMSRTLEMAPPDRERYAKIKLYATYRGGDGPSDAVREKFDIKTLEPNRRYILEPKSGSLRTSAIRDLLADEYLTYVEPATMMAIIPPVTKRDGIFPNDSQFWGQSGIRNIKCPIAWETVKASPDIIVAVLDTGVDYTHFELQDKFWKNPGEVGKTAGHDDDGNGIVDDMFGANFVTRKGDPMDNHGHGTSVASVIAAQPDNRLGMAGVTWGVQLMILKCMEANGTSYDVQDIVDAIDYAIENGAHIINASVGDYSRLAGSRALSNVIKKAEKRGVLLVAAAGNDGKNNDAPLALYPASFDHRNIISVAAIDEFPEQRSDILKGEQDSNYGKKRVDIGAPGDQVLTAIFKKRNIFRAKSGTSFAAPFVSGAAALIWSHLLKTDPAFKLLPKEEQAKVVRRTLLYNARKIANVEKGKEWGYDIRNKAGVVEKDGDGLPLLRNRVLDVSFLHKP